MGPYFEVTPLENQMTCSQAKELFRCCDCRHHLRIRSEMHKVICSVTLEFKDRENIASCEYADCQGTDGKAVFRKTA